MRKIYLVTEKEKRRRSLSVPVILLPKHDELNMNRVVTNLSHNNRQQKRDTLTRQAALSLIWGVGGRL